MKRVVINQDCTCMLSRIGKSIKEGNFNLGNLINFPKEFAGTHITDYVINIDSTFQSNIREGFYEKYYQKDANGKPVDYSDNNTCFAMHYLVDILDIDYNAILIDGFREVGINPWISFRMNDIHDLSAETSIAKSNFRYAHPEAICVKFHPEYHYSNADFAFDYTHECVREHYLAYIEEGLDRYDPYGLELDYTREAILFAHGYHYDGIEIMNDFMRKIKKIVGRFEEKYGHEIKIGVRVAPDIQTNMDFGMNVIKWASEGLVDVIIPSGRFESNDMDLPIITWKTALEPYNVTLLGGIEMQMSPYPNYNKSIYPNIENFAACAAAAYDQGADGVYFFNFFHVDLNNPFDRDMELCFDPNNEIGSNSIYWTTINTIGDPASIEKMNRHHIVTYKDVQPWWQKFTMGGQQLPATPWRQCGFKIHTGDIPKGSKVTFRFAIKDDEHLDIPPRVFMNSEACAFIGTVKNEKYSDFTLMCYNVPASAFKKIACSFIIVSKTVTLVYVDLLVETAK